MPVYKTSTNSSYEGEEGFRKWRDFFCDTVMPLDVSTKIGPQFFGEIEVFKFGNSQFCQSVQNSLLLDIKSQTLKKHANTDLLEVLVVLDGYVSTRMEARHSLNGPGEFVILDYKPTIVEITTMSRVLSTRISRSYIEKSLGKIDLLNNVNIGSNQASTRLYVELMKNMMTERANLTIDMSQKLLLLSNEFLIASISDKMLRDNLHNKNSILIHRARLYIKENITDVSFDVARLAVGLGVSVRNLQKAFGDIDEHVSDIIWMYRLELSAKKLSDPKYSSISIGNLSYTCGFSNHAHFCRRFKNLFGMTPREWRQSKNSVIA